MDEGLIEKNRKANMSMMLRMKIVGGVLFIVLWIAGAFWLMFGSFFYGVVMVVSAFVILIILLALAMVLENQMMTIQMMKK